MLIRFKVGNFLSFGPLETNADNMPVELAMTAGKTRQKQSHVFEDGNLKLIKLAALYGANASGKSNLVRAMLLMKQTVTNGKLPDASFNKYCKSDASNKDKESYFEVEIRLNGKYYAYGFEAVLSRGEFVSEWLTELRPDGKEEPLFSRDIRTGDYDLSGWKSDDKRLRERLDIYAGDIRDDASALFLSVMNQNKGSFYQSNKSASILLETFHWIITSWQIYYPNQPINFVFGVTDMYFQKLLQLMSVFGVEISGFHMRDISDEEHKRIIQSFSIEERLSLWSESVRLTAFLEDNPSKRGSTNSPPQMYGIIRAPKGLLLSFRPDKNKPQECKVLEFIHGNSEIPFQLDEESDGTVRLLDLMEILILGEGKTFVIDELDRCLHPSLTYQFIQTYLEAAAKRDIQLIVTTHESRLMDFDLLRRDEIWFAEKNKRGETQLYSLEEFNTRHDRKIDKAYLEGQYGGVPVFNTVFPFQEGRHESE